MKVFERRRVARRAFRAAAREMDLTPREFAARLLSEDDQVQEEARLVLASVIQSKDVVGDQVVQDLDWEKILEIIMQIAEILAKLLPLFI